MRRVRADGVESTGSAASVQRMERARAREARSASRMQRVHQVAKLRWTALELAALGAAVAA